MLKIKKILQGYYKFTTSTGVNGIIRKFDSIDYKDLPIYNKWIVEFTSGAYSDPVSTYREAKEVAQC